MTIRHLGLGAAATTSASRGASRGANAHGLVRWGLLVCLVGGLLGCLLGCNDVRDFAGAWSGPRIGTDPVLVVGGLGAADAELEISAIDRHGLRGQLRIGELLDAPVASVPGAEADVLAGLTFDGSPLRVYLAFVDLREGDAALSVISLYDDDRVELRLLRGGATPLYAIFALHRGSAGSRAQ